MGGPLTADSDGFYVVDKRTFVPTILTQGPWDPGAQHGGPVAGLLATVVEGTPSLVPMRLVRLTVDLLRPVPLAPLDAARQVVREGKRIQVVDVQLMAGADLVARASALRMRVGDDVTDAAPPPPMRLPGPDDADEPEWASPYVPGFRRAVDMRVAMADSARVMWMRVTVPILAGHPMTPLATLAVAADFTSMSGSGELARGFAAINGDINLHVLREPVGEWVAVDGRTSFSPTGTGMSTSSLYDTSGQVGAASCVQVVDARSSPWARQGGPTVTPPG